VALFRYGHRGIKILRLGRIFPRVEKVRADLSEGTPHVRNFAPTAAWKVDISRMRLQR
jgi:hypothetical protein